MFSSLRSNRFGVPGVISVIALVFAMAGGAYAAKKYVITSTGQIKPSVLKSLQGKAGAPGANGAAGPQGPAGPKGETGAAGSNGAAGAAGVTGATGPTGKEGQTGFTETLPSEETETGAWSFSRAAAGEKSFKLPISFPIPLEEELSAEDAIVLAEGAGGTTDCPGTAAAPKAAPGKLCVYTTFVGGAYETTPFLFNPTKPFSFVEPFGLQNGAGQTGSVLSFTMKGEGFEEFGYGTWAVTAE